LTDTSLYIYISLNIFLDDCFMLLYRYSNHFSSTKLSKIMFVLHVMTRSPKHCCHGNATIRSIFIVVGVDVPGSNIIMLFVAMERQHCVTFAVLCSCKILHTAVGNNRL